MVSTGHQFLSWLARSALIPSSCPWCRHGSRSHPCSEPPCPGVTGKLQGPLGLWEHGQCPSGSHGGEGSHGYRRSRDTSSRTLINIQPHRKCLGSSGRRLAPGPRSKSLGSLDPRSKAPSPGVPRQEGSQLPHSSEELPTTHQPVLQETLCCNQKPLLGEFHTRTKAQRTL